MKSENLATHFKINKLENVSFYVKNPHTNITFTVTLKLNQSNRYLPYHLKRVY